VLPVVYLSLKQLSISALKSNRFSEKISNLEQKKNELKASFENDVFHMIINHSDLISVVAAKKELLNETYT